MQSEELETQSAEDGTI